MAASSLGASRVHARLPWQRHCGSERNLVKRRLEPLQQRLARSLHRVAGQLDRGAFAALAAALTVARRRRLRRREEDRDALDDRELALRRLDPSMIDEYVMFLVVLSQLAAWPPRRARAECAARPRRGRWRGGRASAPGPRGGGGGGVRGRRKAARGRTAAGPALLCRALLCRAAPAGECSPVPVLPVVEERSSPPQAPPRPRRPRPAPAGPGRTSARRSATMAASKSVPPRSGSPEVASTSG